MTDYTLVFTDDDGEEIKKAVVRPKPITLRNAETIQKHADAMRDRIRRANGGEITRYFVEVTKKYPELLNLMDMDGSIREDKIEERMKGYRQVHADATAETGEEQPFNEEQYREKVIAELNREIKNMVNDTPTIAKMLHFVTPQYPADLASLKAGIEVIKAVGRPKELEAISDEDWETVSAQGVADWITGFCTDVAQRGVPNLVGKPVGDSRGSTQG